MKKLIIFLCALMSFSIAFSAPRICKDGVCSETPSTPAKVAIDPDASLYRKDKIGIFLGLQGALGIGIYSDEKVKFPPNEVGYNIGVRIGYNYYFLNYMGVRIYGSYDIDVASFGLAKKNQYSPVPQRFLFNADLMYDMYSTHKATLGIFLGLGAGYAYNIADSTKIYNTFLIPINLGISFVINNSHKIDIYTALPLVANKIYIVDSGTNNYNEGNFKNIMLGVGYSYIF